MEAPAEALVRRHHRVGWWGLFAFASLGLVLETLHGFRVGWYLDVGSESRRLMLRLGHAHGTLLSLLNVAYAVVLASAIGARLAAPAKASRLLVAATVILPGGFLLGGLLPIGDEPGPGVLLVPLGGAALLAALAKVAGGLGRDA
jgi:hypothetical protein